MREILEKEGIAFERLAAAIAQRLMGACVTACRWLDQLIAFGGGKAARKKRVPCSARLRATTWCACRLLGAMDVPELLSCARSLEEFAPD